MTDQGHHRKSQNKNLDVESYECVLKIVIFILAFDVVLSFKDLASALVIGFVLIVSVGVFPKMNHGQVIDDESN